LFIMKYAFFYFQFHHYSYFTTYKGMDTVNLK